MKVVTNDLYRAAFYELFHCERLYIKGGYPIAYIAYEVPWYVEFYRNHIQIIPYHWYAKERRKLKEHIKNRKRVIMVEDLLDDKTKRRLKTLIHNG